MIVIRILFLARYLPAEGSTLYMYTLAKALIRKGHEVHILSAGPNRDANSRKLFDESLSDGVFHHKAGFPINRNLNLVNKLLQLVRYSLATPKALSTLFKIKPDIVNVHYPVTSYLAKIYCMLTGKKFIMTYHTSGIPRHPLHRKADYVIAISSELKNELNKLYKYDHSQIRLIFNGISTNRFLIYTSPMEKTKIKQELGIADNAVIIGFVGRISELKGLDVLLEAASRLEGSYHIVIVGDGDYQWIEALIKKFSMEDKVSVFPFQDPVKFYRIFDIFVLPSLKEGFGIVTIEAMMMGTPVVCTDTGGARDQIDHGVNGYIVERNNALELNRYLDKLIGDSKLREDMGHSSRDKAISLFSEETMVENILLVYKEAL